jgi:hypothetical protein
VIETPHLRKYLEQPPVIETPHLRKYLEQLPVIELQIEPHQVVLQ